MSAAAPLAGVTVIELLGIGPGPYCCQLLADLGARVISIARPGKAPPSVDNRGKESVVIDLRKPGAADLVLRLVERADVLIEGNRPGVAERLGVGPQDCHTRNPALIYGRMTGWGQTGPWAGMAGHDINYIGLTGALLAMGSPGQPPAPPLNLVGDYGGGSLFLALGVLAALLRARQTGQGEVVDAAIIDGTASMMGVVNSLTGIGQWTTARQANMLDGGAPYYRCYVTLDGGYMAVGPIEPQFFARMLELLGIDPAEFGPQNDRSQWPRQHATLERIFASRTRDDWADLFDGQDACVTPVLDYAEAMDHPQMQARASHAVDAAGMVHPAAAPRFGTGSGWRPTPPRPRGADTYSVLAGLGFDSDALAAFAQQGIIQESAHV